MEDVVLEGAGLDDVEVVRLKIGLLDDVRALGDRLLPGDDTFGERLREILTEHLIHKVLHCLCNGALFLYCGDLRVHRGRTTTAQHQTSWRKEAKRVDPMLQSGWVEKFSP